MPVILGKGHRNHEPQEAGQEQREIVDSISRHYCSGLIRDKKRLTYQGPPVGAPYGKGIKQLRQAKHLLRTNSPHHSKSNLRLQHVTKTQNSSCSNTIRLPSFNLNTFHDHAMLTHPSLLVFSIFLFGCDKPLETTHS